MHIKSLHRAETRSISIAAPRETVLDLLGDARRLPEWAPAFAVAVEPSGQDWLIDSGRGQFRIRVRVSLEYGTVDLLRPNDTSSAAHMRVLNHGDGVEFVFTVLFPDGTDEAAIAQQMATVDTELHTVRDLCEAQAGGAP